MSHAFFPIIELVDRLAIAQLKYEKTRNNLDELNWYLRCAQDIDMAHIHSEFDQLKNIHNEIWQLEKELKSGVEHELSLEEIGRRAIEIRNFNNQRIHLKNCMAEKLGCAVREIKQDHLSEKFSH